MFLAEKRLKIAPFLVLNNGCLKCSCVYSALSGFLRVCRPEIDIWAAGKNTPATVHDHRGARSGAGRSRLPLGTATDAGRPLHGRPLQLRWPSLLAGRRNMARTPDGGQNLRG